MCSSTVWKVVNMCMDNINSSLNILLKSLRSITALFLMDRFIEISYEFLDDEVFSGKRKVFPPGYLFHKAVLVFFSL